MSEERIFIEAVRALAVACSIPQFRCELFDDDGNAGSVIAVGKRACKYRHVMGDGRCGPGGASALLRSMAALVGTAGHQTFASALRNAARLTFDTDEQFDLMFLGNRSDKCQDQENI